MSTFDSAVDDMLVVVKAEFGDAAVYTPSGGSPVSVTVVVTTVTIDGGTDYETRSVVKTAEIEKADLDKPEAGDSIQLSTGNYIGTYEVGGVEYEDEYTYIITFS